VRCTTSSEEASDSSIHDLDQVPLINIVNALPQDTDLSAGLALPSSKNPSLTTLVKEYVGILSAADNPTPAGVATAFLSSSATVGKVQVEFDTIHRRLRRRVLEAVVRERFGEDSVRLVRILLETGKMDDKHVRMRVFWHLEFADVFACLQLAKVGMKAAKEVRTTLAAMNNAGLIAMQEVPKSADRAPMRTYYLWYAEFHSCCRASAEA